MAPLPDAHHHRSTTKTSQKPFKSKYSTKSALKELAKGVHMVKAYMCNVRRR